MRFDLNIDLPDVAGTVTLAHGPADFPAPPDDAVGVYVIELWEEPNPEFDWRRANPDAGTDEVAAEPVAMYEPDPDAPSDARFGVRHARYVGQSGRALEARMAEYAAACAAGHAGTSQTSRIGANIREWLGYEDQEPGSATLSQDAYFAASARVWEYREAHPRTVTVRYLTTVDIGIDEAGARRDLRDLWLRLFVENALLLADGTQNMNAKTETAHQLRLRQAEMDALFDEVFGPEP